MQASPQKKEQCKLIKRAYLNLKIKIILVQSFYNTKTIQNTIQKNKINAKTQKHKTKCYNTKIKIKIKHIKLLFFYFFKFFKNYRYFKSPEIQKSK